MGTITLPEIVPDSCYCSEKMRNLVYSPSINHKIGSFKGVAAREVAAIQSGLLLQPD
jgi:hypothetical protein